MADQQSTRNQLDPAYRPIEALRLSYFNNSDVADLMAESLGDYALFALDAEGSIAAWDDSAERLFGYSREDAIGKAHSVIFTTPDIENETADKELLTTLQTGRAKGARWMARRDGSRFWGNFVVTLLRDDKGEPRGYLKLVRDLSDQKDMEEALRHSEDQFRFLFESNPQPMWMYDADTLAFLAVNESALRKYGYSREEFLLMTIKDIRPPEDIPAVLKAARNVSPGFNYSGQWRHRKKDGSIINVEVTNYSVALKGKEIRLVQAIDLTQQMRAEEALHESEEKLRQSQKLESIGRLAGGIAHDFNNLLTAIIGYSEICLNELREDDPLRNSILEISKASERAADLTHQLLAFSRRQVLQPRVIDLNAVISDLNRMLRRLLGEDVELVTQLDSSMGRVKADPGQIQQVIINLAVNARDAMPRGGKLIIETANIEMSDQDVQNKPELSPGPYAMITVSDNGTGMDESIIEKIFEPFFTTKETGKGTGLGLATVYGIVAQSEGHIQVHSQLGRGSTFNIYLPRIDAEVERVAEAPVSQSEYSGTETILLVEDDEIVRRMAQMILGRNGYNVLVATNGGEALLICEQYEETIDLMLTDVVMPRMSGRVLAERLLSLRPEMNVLYMSGYSEDAIAHHGVLDEGINFIEKPFTPDTLARRTRQLLDSAWKREHQRKMNHT